MKFDVHSAPHIRSGNNNRRIMFDMLSTLAVIYFMSGYYYGARVWTICGISVLSGFVANTVSSLILYKKVNMMDFSFIVTSMLIGLIMPIGIPVKIIIIANVFAIILGKHFFGGTGQNIFNPAAVGMAISIIMYGADIFKYEAPFDKSGASYKSIAYNIFVGGVPQAKEYDILIGNVASPIGTAFIYLILACSLYLIVRRTIRWRQAILTLITIGVGAYFFPRVNVNGWMSVFYEICAVPTLFFVLFMLTDPVTSPARAGAIDFYAVLSGIVILLFRHQSVFEISEPFAILVLNFLVPTIDSVAENLHTRRRRAIFAKRQQERQRDFIKEN